MADHYRRLPLEQRIGALRDGDATHHGEAVGSMPLAVQPPRRPTVADKKRFALDGYVDVPTRLRMALNAFPELRIVEQTPRIIDICGDTFIEVTIVVYRTPEDTHPVYGSAWEPYPGTTSYTRRSEMMVAGTSALGRALGYLGFGIDRSIASIEEISNRRHEDSDPTPAGGIERPPTEAQLIIATRVANKAGVDVPAFSTRRELNQWLKEMQS